MCIFYAKLFEKKISPSFSCLWCEEEPDTCDHVLWRCEFAQRVWGACSVPIPEGVDIRPTFMGFMECCLKALDTPDVEIIFTIAWMLWKARNELMWDGSPSNVANICCRAFVLAIEFLEVGDGETVAQPKPGDRKPLHWSPPIIGSYKVSIACHSHSGSTRVGLVF